LIYKISRKRRTEKEHKLINILEFEYFNKMAQTNQNAQLTQQQIAGLADAFKALGFTIQPIQPVQKAPESKLKISIKSSEKGLIVFKFKTSKGNQMYLAISTAVGINLTYEGKGKLSTSGGYTFVGSDVNKENLQLLNNIANFVIQLPAGTICSIKKDEEEFEFLQDKDFSSLKTPLDVEIMSGYEIIFEDNPSILVGCSVVEVTKEKMVGEKTI
jgi:hypothetical protein